MLSVDYSLIIQIVNFLFLLFLMNIIVYRPIRGILNKRKEEISSSAESAQEWNQKADKFSEELEENIAETRTEGFKEREALKGEGLAEERDMLVKVASSVEEKIGKAREEIQKKIEQARQSLQGELESFSHELAEKILGRSV